MNVLESNVEKTKLKVFPTKKFDSVHIRVNNIPFINTDIVKFLGHTIDDRLKGKSHIDELCKEFKKNF